MAKRIVQLDGIRAIAIAAVFLQHVFFIRLLWMGVDLFFILSGFLITGILIEHKEQTLRGYFGRFYGRRADAFSPYLLFLSIGLLFYGVWWLRHWYLYAFLMNLIAPLGVLRPGQFDPLWSLAVEEQFYFVWPFAVYFLSEDGLAKLALAFMAAAPILRWTCTPWFSTEWPIYMLTPFRMDTLAAGALMAIAWRKYRGKFERFGQYGLILSAVSISVLMFLSDSGVLHTRKHESGKSLDLRAHSDHLCRRDAVGFERARRSAPHAGACDLPGPRQLLPISYSSGGDHRGRALFARGSEGSSCDRGNLPPLCCLFLAFHREAHSRTPDPPRPGCGYRLIEYSC